MNYRTKDEFDNFNFDNSSIYKMSKKGENIVFELGYVSILGSNSCNRDIREMGTNELLLTMYHVSESELVKEGCKVFDADGKLMNKSDDEVILEDKLEEMFSEMGECSIYSVEKQENQFVFYIDAPEQTYKFTLRAEHDIEEWDRFMNKTPSY